MKRFFSMAIAACICAVAAGDAQAVVIDFETMDTTHAPLFGLVLHGDYVTQDGYTFQTFANYPDDEAAGSLVGALVNGADASTCLSEVCPGGNATNYIETLNDGYIVFGRTNGGSSTLSSFDAAFQAHTDAAPLDVPGLLRIVAVKSDGSSSSLTWNLGAVRSGGATSFNSYIADFGSDAEYFIAYAFRCDATGHCSAFDTNEGQFAFDNVVLEASPSATVPEPATWAMLLLGFGGVGSALRRQRNRLPLAA